MPADSRRALNAGPHAEGATAFAEEARVRSLVSRLFSASVFAVCAAVVLIATAADAGRVKDWGYDEDEFSKTLGPVKKHAAAEEKPGVAYGPPPPGAVSSAPLKALQPQDITAVVGAG